MSNDLFVELFRQILVQLMLLSFLDVLLGLNLYSHAHSDICERQYHVLRKPWSAGSN